MAEQKPREFIVRPKPGAESRFVREPNYRIVRAKRQSQVEAFIASDFEIAIATNADMHAAGKDGVEIEEASE